MKKQFLEELKKEQRLRVWWIPHVGMDNGFSVEVRSLEQAILIENTLAQYDTFQFENKINSDYCNVGGVEIYVGDRPEFEREEWTSYFNNDLFIDSYREFRIVYEEIMKEAG